MPFIPQKDRRAIDDMVKRLESLDQLIARVWGEFDAEGVAYVLYAFVKQSYGFGRWRHRKTALGILASVKKEYYESSLREYENEAKRKNGDVT